MKSMNRTLIAIAGSLTLVAGAAAAGGPGGGHGGGGGGFGQGLGRGFGPPATSVNPGTSIHDEARENRQGPQNASPTGVANANEHAGLSSTTASDLTGLKTGLTVKDSSGTTIGTVRKIEKSKDGTIHNVLVASATGNRTIRLAPNSITISGGVVTATDLPKD